MERGERNEGLGKHDLYYQRTKKLVILGAALFVLGLGLVLLGFQWRSERSLNENILSQARAHGREFDALRMYVQGFAGIYVPASAEVTANPHLEKAHGAMAAFDAPNGKTFVLQNSPLVVRSVADKLAKASALDEPLVVRMVGPEPLNPANAPDAFERRAIRELGEGKREVYAYEGGASHSHFRYAIQVPCKGKCADCHAGLEAQADGVAGVISVDMDVTKTIASVRRSRASLATAFLVVLALVAVSLYLMVTRVLVRLRDAQDELSRLASTDALTGLLNRRQGIDRLGEEVARARRDERPLCVAMLDLDDFKKVNDTQGHTAGDVALIAAAHAVRQAVREGDVLARIGGEEFLLLLPDTSLEEGVAVVQRAREAVAFATSTVLPTPVTASAGITILPPGARTRPDDLYAEADEALLRAKDTGRDQLVLATDAAEGARSA